MQPDESQRLSRVIRLTGMDAAERLTRKSVIIFGLGGVGSWAAEALARTGIGEITLVDADDIAVSNINRQLPALVSTVGESKCEVLRSRLLDINPDAKITVCQARYTAQNADDFDLGSYDYVIDAIDSLADKALLILRATSCHTKLYSSMGAAMKMNPERIHTAEFWKVTGDPLAAALRRKFKKSGLMPRKKFKCVYSDELIPNAGPNIDVSGAMSFDKVAFNGALCHITAIFGMTLASLVINDALKSRL